MAVYHTLLIHILVISAFCSIHTIAQFPNGHQLRAHPRRTRLQSLIVNTIIPSGSPAPTGSSLVVKSTTSSQASNITAAKAPTIKPSSFNTTENKYTANNPTNSVNDTQKSPPSATIVNDFDIIAQRRIVNIIDTLTGA